MFKQVWNSTSKWSMRWGNRASQFMVIIGGGRPLNLTDLRATEEALKNSAAVATVSWVQRNISKAPITVGKYDSNGVVKVVNSPLTRKLKRPNAFYSGNVLLKAVVWDYLFSGNAYILKVRRGDGGVDGRGRVDELWWVPSTNISPQANKENDKIYIDHYRYTVNSKEETIDVRDVIHFRDGFDPENTMLGMSKFRSLLREVCTDNEANLWTWALLKNMGVPGIVISPGKETEITKEDAEQMKDNFVARFTGTNRGMPLVTSAPVEVKSVAFDPKQMDLRAIKQMAEERMTAIVGLPAVVVGLGAGLQANTFSSFPEAREAAYEACMIPLQDDLADVMEMHLLPEFHNPETHTLYFDISGVRELQPDINAHHVRVRGDWLSGLFTLNQALIDLGKPPIGEAGEVRAVPNGVTLTSKENLVVQLPSAGLEPTDTGDPDDDRNGNPEGGAPNRDEETVSEAEKVLLAIGDKNLEEILAKGMKNGQTH